MFQKSVQAQDKIGELFQACEYAKAMQEIRTLAEEANKYFDEKAPWKTIKDDPEGTKQVLTSVINIYKNILIYLKPVIPEYAKKAETVLNVKPLTWNDLSRELKGHKLNPYTHLAVRLEMNQIDKMIEEEKANASANASKKNEPRKKESTLIEFDDFMKVELKTAKIIECNPVEGADKLLQITADLGGGDTKNIFAGIKNSYSPDQLVGKTVVIVANLKPRTMKFGVSEAMILAVESEDGLSVVEPEKSSKPGVRVK
ncbi:MAG: methionine--tRNA ligase subunit beta [Bdellovibrionales bacterium]